MVQGSEITLCHRLLSFVPSCSEANRTLNANSSPETIEWKESGPQARHVCMDTFPRLHAAGHSILHSQSLVPIAIKFKSESPSALPCHSPGLIASGEQETKHRIKMVRLSVVGLN